MVSFATETGLPIEDGRTPARAWRKIQLEDRVLALSTTGGHLAKEQITRRLAAILAADVAGYSRMMGADEEGTLAAMRQIWSETFNPAVAERHGRIVKTMGDGALVEFLSVVDAVECAVAIQHAMARRNRTAGRPVEFRIGINLGEIVVDGDDIFGDGVNIAARLEGQAPHGGILASEAVHAQVAGKLGAP
jgi:class 3 adenylate cyclase